VYEGACDDAALERAYAAAAFTVYPSLAEGFGLPVAESLARGKPCVCSGRGAVGEIAAGGGCVMVDPPDALHLRQAIGGLLRNPAELSTLSQVACRRRFATTADHARRLSDWMATLVPKAKVANA
jgi:glycosyltransferase involved in cell wall biosynthesis